MMSKVNLVNAYFDGDLSESQVHDFKNQLNSDPDLKREFDFQSDIVNGLKEARSIELKAMLNNVTVGGANVASGGLSLGKIAASVLLLGIVGTGIVWHVTNDSAEQLNSAPPSVISEEVTPFSEENIIATDEGENTDDDQEVLLTNEQEKLVNTVEANTAKTKRIEEKVADEQSVAITKPDIRKPEIVTSFENEDEDEEGIATPENGLGTKAKNNMPTIDVDVDNTKKKYTFHYQLKDGRLILYGSFDKGLYEILEFNTTSGKNVFLYYKDEYFALSENKEKVTPLIAVKDKELIQKLIKARSDN